MRLLCCFTNNKITPEALLSFGRHAPGIEMVNCTGDWASRDDMKDSLTRYWHSVRDRWTGEEALVVVKQNRPIREDTLPTLDKCGGMLCIKDGCTRYSVELQRRIPADTIGGEYMVWHLVEERLGTLWTLHNIPVHLHPSAPEDEDD